MQFSFRAPPPELADSVKSIWLARGTKQDFSAPEPIVPDGCVELIFNLGDRFTNKDTGELQPRALLAGQMTRPVVALPSGAVDLIGVRFRTGRAGASLRLPMWELQDKLIAASDVIRGLDRVVEQLTELTDNQRLVHLIGVLATRLATPDASSMSNIDHALELIDASRGTASIEHISRQIGVTRRHLERQFREYVGLGAKHVARISRIHQVLYLLQHQTLMGGAELAATCGYSDQAHMIRECQALTGQTPRRLKTTDSSLASLMRDPS